MITILMNVNMAGRGSAIRRAYRGREESKPDAQKTMRDWRAVAKRARKAVSDLQRRVADATKEIRTLRNGVRSLRGRLADLKCELRSLRNRMELKYVINLEKDNKKYLGENLRLRANLATAKRAKNAKGARYFKEISDQNAYIEELEARLATHEEARNNLGFFPRLLLGNRL